VPASMWPVLQAVPQGATSLAVVVQDTSQPQVAHYHSVLLLHLIS